MLSVWRKPPKVYLSREWGRFSDVSRAETPVEYELRLVNDEWTDKCMELVDVFIKEDPLLKVLDLSSDSKSVCSLKFLMQQYLAQDITIGCFLKTPETLKLVAIDVMHVRTNNDRPLEVEENCGESHKRLLKILHYADKQVNIFKHYGVLKFLTSFGIIIDPEYRTELMLDRILNTRKSIAEALGIDVVSQLVTEELNGDELMEKTARRSEYEVLAELSSEDIQDEDIILRNYICNFKVISLILS